MLFRSARFMMNRLDRRTKGWFGLTREVEKVLRSCSLAVLQSYRCSLFRRLSVTSSLSLFVPQSLPLLTPLFIKPVVELQLLPERKWNRRYFVAEFNYAGR